METKSDSFSKLLQTAQLFTTEPFLLNVFRNLSSLSTFFALFETLALPTNPGFFTSKIGLILETLETLNDVLNWWGWMLLCESLPFTVLFLKVLFCALVKRWVKAFNLGTIILWIHIVRTGLIVYDYLYNCLKVFYHTGFSEEKNAYK